MPDDLATVRTDRYRLSPVQRPARAEPAAPELDLGTGEAGVTPATNVPNVAKLFVIAKTFRAYATNCLRWRKSIHHHGNELRRPPFPGVTQSRRATRASNARAAYT
jgi:hypothetical protein